MTSHIAEMLRTATDALNAGDVETFSALHADDVVVHVTGRNAYSGILKGKAEMASVLQRQMEILDGPPRFEIHDALSSEEHGVLLGTQRATRGGRTLESKVAVITHVRDGKFSELWVMSDDPYAEDEFFA
jgi:uncharacterized protein